MKLFCFVFAMLLFGRLGGYNYSAIHVQVNSIAKGDTTHVQNKRSDFNRGYFLGDTLYNSKSIGNKVIISTAELYFEDHSIFAGLSTI